MTVTKTVTVPANHRLMIDVPTEIPEGDVVLTFTPAGSKKPTMADIHGKRIRGIAKGQFWMADDFDAPLEDFKDCLDPSRPVRPDARRYGYG